MALVPAHGNYTLHNINTTKMCRNFVNASCLALYDGYLNCLQALQRLDDSDHAMNDLPPGKKPSSGKKTVIIITCLAVVTGEGGSRMMDSLTGCLRHCQHPYPRPYQNWDPLGQQARAAAAGLLMLAGCLASVWLPVH